MILQQFRCWTRVRRKSVAVSYASPVTGWAAESQRHLWSWPRVFDHQECREVQRSRPTPAPGNGIAGRSELPGDRACSRPLRRATELPNSMILQQFRCWTRVRRKSVAVSYASPVTGWAAESQRYLRSWPRVFDHQECREGQRSCRHLRPATELPGDRGGQQSRRFL